jgi:hypothetical protein
VAIDPIVKGFSGDHQNEEGGLQAALDFQRGALITGGGS